MRELSWRERKPYDQLDRHFSSDGSLMAYAARNNKDKSWRIVVTARKGPILTFTTQRRHG